MNPFRAAIRFFTKKKYRIVYGAWTLHPDTGKIVCGYVGKDSNPPGRPLEHMQGGTSRQPAPSPWSDTVVFWARLYGGRMSRFTLWWLEIVLILTFWPVYNYRWNRHNPRRIPRYVAARRERSAAYRRAKANFRRRPWRLRLLRSL